MNFRLSPPYRLVLASALLLLWCLGFGWWQSGEGRVGGPMSLAKVLWLFLALWHFYLVPAWLWRDRGLDAAARTLWGWFFAGFVLRAVIEIPLLISTRLWRCEHGIAHDAVMLLLLFVMSRRLPPESSRVASTFVWLAGLALLFEATNAWLFRHSGNPAEGIYFASDEAHFRLINAITWGEIAVLFPLLVWWMARYVGWFGRKKTKQ
jgi:hypothetical protein